MDPISTVRTDALPAVATLVIPGAVATVPYAWSLLESVEPLRRYFDSHDGIGVFVAVVSALAAGFLIESLGSFVEVYLIDRRRPDHVEQREAWWRYLRIAWTREPIGQRYLRRLLVTFKFELNMCVATLLFSLGSLLLVITDAITCATAICLLLAGALSAIGFFLLARTSSDVLTNVRTQLLAGVGEPPIGESSDPVNPPSA